MAKQLNINMQFTADNAQAKASIQDLQNSLTKLMSSSKLDLGISKNIDGAISKVAELQSHLQNAINVDTGNLDFSKLSASLKKSQTSLMDYGKTLQALGPQGQQAFMALTQSVMNAEVPIRRANKMLHEMGTTLMNTARWQISSSILHGFMGAIQSAYGYAQDLNESLNNIRIVTGQSIDQMARFADEANKAAKALSTTTTEYTNASLIYYQQGLNDQQVKERTDITIKMAQAAGQSAQVVSDQLTAVWNNFDDGSKSLEYYADVMTALGAATASSTDEITAGLEKFASVAETVGLSFDYATAALATVTATTRQSADVVGTAFKTLFARLQDLKLGKTLEDGTDLGTYTENLAKVGINIKTASGSLKDMDVILEETAAKWRTLEKDQQVALAKGVAGIRQYNTFISLMNNWDFMEQNLATAKNSSGTLQQQADIYAESWEAAQDRVKAAMEGVYDSLISDEFFINMLNSVEKIIGLVDHLIDNLGGVKGVLLALGAIVTKVFSKQLSQGITNMAYNLKMMSTSGQQAVQNEKKAFINQAKTSLANMEGDSSTVNTTAVQVYEDQLSRQQQMIDNAERMNEMEQRTVQILMDQLKVKGDLAIESAKQVDQAKKNQTDAASRLYERAAAQANAEGIKFDVGKTSEQLKYLRESAKASDSLKASLEQVSQAGEVTEQNITDIYNVFKNLQNQTKNPQTGVSDIVQPEDLDQVEQLLLKLQNIDAESEDWQATLEQIRGLMGGINQGVQTSASEVIGADLGDIENYSNAVERTASSQRNLNNINKEAKQINKEVEDTINSCKGAQASWSDIIVSSANLAFSAATALSMLGSAFDTLRDPDVSGWQKFLTILSTLGMVVPTLISLFTTFKTLLSTENVVKLANVAATLAQVAAEKALNKEKGEGSEKTRKSIKDTVADTKQKLGQSVKDFKQNMSNKRADFDKGVWDKLDDKSKDKYLGDAMKKKGYTWEADRGKSGMFTKRGADGKVIGSVGKGGAEQMAGQSAMKAAGTKAIGTAAGGVALIAAGVAVAVGAVKWGIAQFEKQSKAAEEAAQNAARAGQEYQKASDAYNTFTSNMDNYNNGVAGLEELTKGTTEYREAVLKANEAAMELINSTEGLQYSVNSDGLIEIDEESMKKAQEEKLNTMQKAQNAKLIADVGAKEKKMESEKTDFARNELRSSQGAGIGVGNTLAATGSGAAAGALIGAGIGTIVPVIGNAVGAAVGAAIGGVAGLVTGIVGSTNAGASSSEEQEALDKLAALYEKEGNAAFATDDSLRQALIDSGVTDQALIDSLVENREGTLELVTAIHENTKANELLNQQLAANAVEGNEDVQESEYKDQITNILGADMDKYRENALDDLNDEGWGTEGINAASGKNDKEAQAVFEEYAKAAGLDLNSVALEDIKGTDGNRKFVYKDADGNEQTVSLDDMKATVAADRAQTKASEQGSKMAETFKDMEEQDVNTIEAMKTGDLSNLSGSQLEAIQKGEVDAESMGLSEEDMKNLGYGSFLGDAIFKAQMEKLQKQAEEEMEGISLEGLDSGLKDGMSLDTMKAIQGQIDDMNLGPMGEEAGRKYTEGLNKMLEGVDVEDQQAALTELGQIDWSSADAMEQADAIMKQYGVDINTADAYWTDFAAKMKDANRALPDFSSLTTDLQNVSSVLNDLDFGKTISDEDYQKLMDYNDEWDRFFVMQADGTRKFIGDKDEMMKATRDNIVAQKEELEIAKQRIEAIKNSGADWNLDANAIDKMVGGDGKDGKVSAETLANYNKEHGTSYESSDDLVNNVMADKTQELIDSNADIKAVLNESGYDDATIQTILQEARDGNRERLDAMLTSVDTYMAQDLEATGAQLDEMLASTATSIEDLNRLVAEGQISTEAYEKQVTVLAESATSLEELQEITALDDGTYSADAYSKGLQKLAENFDNCAEEAEEYKKALLMGNEAQVAAAQEALEASIAAGELAQQYDLNAEELEDYAKRLQTLNKDQKLSASEATRLAAANMRLDRGVSNLNDNLKDYKKALKDSNKGSAEWSKALSDLKTDLADITNIADGSMLSDTFAEAVVDSEDLKRALDGDTEAILRLRLAAADDIIANLDVTGDDLETVTTQWEYLKANMASGIASPNVDQTQLINSFNEMIKAGNMTKEEIEAAMSGLNVSANLKTTYVKQTTEVPTYIDVAEPMTPVKYQTGTDADGNPIWGEVQGVKRYTVPGEPMKVEGSVPVYEIETETGEDANGNQITTAFTKAPEPVVSHSVTTTGKEENGGGSKSKPKKTEKLNRDDYLERYAETESALDDVRDAYDDASKAADRLYGAGRIAAMARANAELLKEIKLLKQKKQEAQEYLKIDRADLKRKANAAGVDIDFDDSGEVLNYKQAVNQLGDEYDEMVEKMNATEEPSEEENEALEEKKKQIDDLRDSYEQYNETRETIEDIDNEIQDKFYEWQDNNFEMWSHSLEVTLDITDDASRVLEMLLKRTEGNFFRQAEGLAIMYGQLAMTNIEMGAYIGHLGVLGGLMATGSISPESFVEGLNQVQEGAFAAAEAIYELDQKMINYYGEALNMAREEINIITDQLEHGTSILEHYLSLVDLMGHQTDYKNRGTILAGQVHTLKNELDSIYLESEYMSQEAVKKKRMLDSVLLPTTAEVYEQQYKDALNAAMETQEEFLSKAEEYAEAVNALLENTLNELGQDLENILTGGTSFDQMTREMDHLVSLQEEYLTTTNKIYETEKLMNKAQQEIDKTTNTVAKAKLKQFIAETDQLKEKNKLSKFELDVQQAKYDLLLAEIALEEAQNAKSSVRLQRDAEGNFGYVYTADQSAISDAEQELADKQNAFYNIALEGVNNYAEKYYQTLEEMYDTLLDIDKQYQEGAFESWDEYQNARLEAENFYLNKLRQYSELYNIAIQLDSNATAESWGIDYKDMINSTDKWEKAVRNHAIQVENAFLDWGKTMDDLADKTSTRMTDLATSVGKVTAQSDELANELENDLMPKIKAEMNLVSILTGIYAALRIVVLGLAAAYMALGTAMMFAKMAASMGSMVGAIDFSGAADALSETASTLGGNDSSGSGSATKTSTESGGSQKSSKKTIDLEKGHTIYDYVGASAESLKYGGTYDVMEERGDYLVIGKGGTETGKIKKPEGWATGGYTGEWGSYGKLAMLHEKELILNKDDTKNFLASMDLLDSIVSTIDLHAANQSVGGLINSPSVGHIGGDTLEQSVTIEANFPSVQSRSEIEEAFTTLVNRASQYANRK